VDDGRKWYETAFRETYLLTYPHRDDASASREIAAIVALLGLSGTRARILDLCSGTGRHAAALAKSGFDVVGLDLSSVLLAKAADRGELAGRLVRADMRRLPLGEEFDVVLSLFTSFGYFADDAVNEAVAREMFRVLAPGGKVLIDHMNPASVKRNVGEDERDLGGRKVRQRRWIEGKRIRKEIVIAKKPGEETKVMEDVRIYEPGEMKALLRAAGFEGVRILGSVQGEELTPASDRMIAVAARAGR
jgi:SAM-dependent methyltransferase